jgi:hypothetical protein
MGCCSLTADFLVLLLLLLLATDFRLLSLLLLFVGPIGCSSSSSSLLTPAVLHLLLLGCRPRAGTGQASTGLRLLVLLLGLCLRMLLLGCCCVGSKLLVKRHNRSWVMLLVHYTLCCIPSCSCSMIYAARLLAAARMLSVSAG